MLNATANKAMKNLIPKSPTSWWRAFVALAFVVATMLISQHIVFAQTESGEWTTPINLSKSGGSANPRIVVDANHDVLVIWDDIFSRTGAGETGYGIARREAGLWGPPVRVELPLSNRSTQLLSGRNDVLHALWLDEDGTLRYKRLITSNFHNPVSWFGSLQIASSVINFHSVVDSDGRIHIAYVRADESDGYLAGVYYLRPAASQDLWAPPLLIYSSDYLRRFAVPGEGLDFTGVTDPQLAHVSIEATRLGEANRIFIAWDNPPLKRVFLTQSLNGEASWEPLIEIDEPDQEKPYTSSRNIFVVASGNQVLLFWQRFETGGSCSQVFQSSDDGGTTWSAPKSFLGQFLGCPETIQSLGETQNASIFFVTFRNQAYLLAWDGVTWSIPQSQAGIASFLDEETVNFVEFGCLQAGMISGDIVVVGCDLGTGKDIWMTQRSLGEIGDWFRFSLRWTQGFTKPIGTSEIISLASAIDSRGITHALWSQPGVDLDDNPSSAIYYASWDQKEIAGPFPILQELLGLTRQLVLSTSPEERLLMMWSGGIAGEMSYSWTSTEQASSSTGWFSPDQLQPLDAIGHSPSVVIDRAGKLSMAYLVPANENRGVYLKQLETGGLEWGESRKIFDGVIGGCEFLEQSSLAVTGADTLHAVWICSTLPGGIGPLSLHYSRSETGGQSWIPTQQLLERGVDWARVVGVGESSVHVVWEESRLDKTNTWHMFSQDGGQTWEEPRSIPFTDGKSIARNISADRFGQLHLLQVVQKAVETAKIKYSYWDGGSWLAGEDLQLEGELALSVQELSASVGPDDRLVAVMIGESEEETDEGPQNVIAFVAIPVQSKEQPGTEQAVDVIPLAVDGERISSTPIPDTLDASPISIDSDLSEVERPGTNQSFGLIIGIALTVLMVSIFVFVRVRSLSSKES